MRSILFSSVTAVLVAGLATSCQFKKKNFVEESKEQIGDIAKEQARQKDLQNRAYLQKEEITVAVKEEKAPFKYTGLVRLPERVTHVAYKIEEAPMFINENKDADENWKTILTEENEKGNVITFPAKSAYRYKITVSSVTEIGVGNPIVLKIKTPKDYELRPNEMLTINKVGKQQFLLSLGRLFLNENSRINVLIPGFKIQAKKIIAKPTAVISTKPETPHDEIALFSNPPNLDLEVDEIVGTLRVELRGIDGTNGVSGADTPEYLKLLEQQRPGTNGIAAVTRTRDMTFCRKTGVEQACFPNQITECVSNATSGSDGKNALLGVKGLPGYPGSVPGLLRIKLLKPSAKGKISYLSISGRHGANGLYSPEIPATQGGIAGIHHPRCPTAPSAGKRGLSIDEQVSRGLISSELRNEFADRRKAWGNIPQQTRGKVIIEELEAQTEKNSLKLSEVIVEEEMLRPVAADGSVEYNMPSLGFK